MKCRVLKTLTNSRKKKPKLSYKRKEGIEGKGDRERRRRA